MFYIIKLVWEASPAIMFVMAFMALFNGVMPVIGIPLPLLSAGGTSVLSLYAAVGLVMSVYYHRRKEEHMFYTEKYD